MLRQVAMAGVQEAKARVPRKTGNLARTIRVGPISASALELHAGGVSGVGYAAAVELGSGPHVIVPRTKKALSFASQKVINERFGAQRRSSFRLSGRLRASAQKRFGNAAFITVRRVNHPGSRPKPYLLPGLEAAVGRVGPDGIIAAWNRGA
jgi:hypothetical protein